MGLKCGSARERKKCGEGMWHKVPPAFAIRDCARRNSIGDQWPIHGQGAKDANRARSDSEGVQAPGPPHRMGLSPFQGNTAHFSIPNLGSQGSVLK
jgi:hypothetical protein